MAVAIREIPLVATPTTELKLLTGTKFPKRVITGDPRPLKPGGDNEKLGFIVKKGPLKGARLFQLSLEERATCPTSCGQWKTCYGNHMPWALRQTDGPYLRMAIERQLGELCRKYEKVLVRLHVIGDMTSVSYVIFWQQLLGQHPALHLYGYTHWSPSTPIGAAVQNLLNSSDRCRILLSCDKESDLDVLTEGGYSIVVDKWADIPAGFTKCPAELTDRKISCVQCTLCFSGEHDIAFKRH